MSLIDIRLHRHETLKPLRFSQPYQPRLELLEERQCLSVTAPTGLNAVALSTTQVQLSWNDVVREQGYRIFLWSGTQAVQVGSVKQDALTYKVANLKGNTTYYFCVESYDATTAARSYWAVVTTPIDPITAPTNARVMNVAPASQTIQWGSAPGATGYNVYGWDGARAYLIGSTSPLVTSFNVQNLRPGVTYYYYVQAFNPSNKANSPWVSATTPATALTAPTNVKAQAISTNAIGLSWTNVVGAAGYKIYVWDGQSTHSPVMLATVAPTTNGYQATGLLPGVNYWFYVQAFNGANSADSERVMATTFPATVFAAPTNVAAVVSGTNSVVVSWTEPARAAGYDVFRWTGYSWTLVNMVNAGTHRLSIAGLTAHQTHWFYVRAFTSTGEISNSSSVFAIL
jgi:hypothetical protein